jgi:calcium-dependent protein kinase
MAKQHVDHIFRAVDTDHNGTIDCHEFIRCIIDR